jgi:hypothetical protein
VKRVKELSVTGTGKEMKPVTNGMMERATKRKRVVVESISVTSVERPGIEERSVEDLQTEERSFPKRPNPDTTPLFSPTTSCTLSDAPLPRPPPGGFNISDAISTIKQNPHLFRIVTPINTHQFEESLPTPNPNQPFVISICVSLREEFWPWAHTQKESYLITWDFSHRPPKTERKADFLKPQRDAEIGAGRYSEGFATELLPGMYGSLDDGVLG